MAQPKTYERQFAFAGNPRPGWAEALEHEFNAVKVSSDQTLANLTKIQRDDGALRNQIVTRDSLSAELTFGVRPTEPWQTATAYLVGATISYKNGMYRCVKEHISGNLDADIAAGLWELFAEFTPEMASNDDARALVDPDKTMAPAQVRTAVEQAEFSLDAMANPETLAAIINRTGRTPLMEGATAADSSHHAAINSAIDKVITGGGGIVWLPPIAGEWKIGGSINLHKTGYTGSYLKLQGIGEKVRMTRLNASGDIFVAGDGTHPVYYVTLRNILLNASVARTSGIDLKLTNASQMNFEDLVFDGSYSAFYGENLNTIYVTRAVFNLPNTTSGYGAVVRSDPSGSGRTDIVKFAEVTLQAYNAGSYGLLVEGRVHGMHTDGLYALGCRRGLQITSSAPSTSWGDIPSFGDYRKFETDRALDYSATLEKGYRNEFHRAEFSNTSGAMDVPYPQGSADDCAVFLGPGMTDTKFFAGRIGNCRLQAVQDHSTAAQFFGTTFNDMSKIGAGTAAAVYIGTTARGFNYQGCRVEGHDRASYAFQIEAAAKNGIIRDTIYKDLVSGFSIGTGTNVTIAGQVDDT